MILKQSLQLYILLLAALSIPLTSHPAAAQQAAKHLIRKAIIFGCGTAAYANASLSRAHAEEKPTEEDVPPTANTYQGTPITAENILELTPKLGTAEEQAINKWMYDNHHIISALTNIPVHGKPHERLKRHEEICAFIEACGMKNLSAYNFVFKIAVPVGTETKTFVVKIAGSPNLRENLTALLNRPYGSPIKLEDYQKLEAEKQVTTYQTISRAAHALRAEACIKENNIEGIIVPSTYLIHIPGQDTTVSDHNYVIVEKYIENIGTPEDHPLIFLKHAHALETLIRYTGLWNIGSRQFVITLDGKVAIVDLEQPNNTPGHTQFFHKNEKKYQGNTNVGLQELNMMIKELFIKKLNRDDIQKLCRLLIPKTVEETATGTAEQLLMILTLLTKSTSENSPKENVIVSADK